MGRSSGSAMNVNFLPVNSSTLTGSTAILFFCNLITVASISSTSNAICRKPVASGLDGLAGGWGNENNSITIFHAMKDRVCKSFFLCEKFPTQF